MRPLWHCLTVIPQPTEAQKQSLFNDRHWHRVWLETNKIEEAALPLGEDPYTGLLLAALLDPDARSSVLRGILAGAPASASAFSSSPLTAAQWPTRGVDLVARFGHGAASELLLVEHKRFRSHSHAPGYRRDPDAPWQTDQVYSAAMGSEPPAWLGEASANQVKNFIVLDAHGKSMEQLFPGGQFNDRWTVTSYLQFGAALRAEHSRGVRGLVPLLAALYAGC